MDTLKSETGWGEITDENGIRELMALFGQLHDGCILELHVVTGHFIDENLSYELPLAYNDSHARPALRYRSERE